MKSNVVHRYELSDGRVVIVQRIRRGYICYLVGVELFDAPEVLAKGRIAPCRDAYLSVISSDVLDEYI